MGAFRDQSIRVKLMLASLLAGGAALVLAGAAFVTYDLIALRAEMVRNVSIQADIIGSNAQSALLFSDPQSAEATLSALTAEPHVMAAAVYTPEGEPFAAFLRADLSGTRVLPDRLADGAEGHRFERDRLVLSRPILFDRKPIGTLLILSDLREVATHLRRYVVIVAAVLIVSMVLAFPMVVVLQRRIAEPILHLAQTARRIAVEKDYGVRASGDSRDEIGLLVAAFNQMLDQIRARDAELREAHDRLEQRVADRTAQLEGANKELEAFSYSVSHDLRAPLRHIAGFADLLEQEGGDGLGEAAQRYIHKISGAAGRMGQLIDDLLVFSRMGRSEMQRARVNLADLLKDVLKEVQPDPNRRRIEWSIGRLPEVQGDTAMLRQVLANLISNAVKYTGKREDPRIEVGAKENGGREVVVFVRDNGVGFDMQYAPKLFGVFQRLHRADEFEGTGIGLANVRRIVHRHGGRTWAEGRPGEGAVFYFSLPKIQEGLR